MKRPITIVPPETPAERLARQQGAAAFAASMLRSDANPYGPPNPRFPLEPVTPEPGIDCTALDAAIQQALADRAHA